MRSADGPSVRARRPLFELYCLQALRVLVYHECAPPTAVAIPVRPFKASLKTHGRSITAVESQDSAENRKGVSEHSKGRRESAQITVRALQRNTRVLGRHNFVYME